MKPSDLFSKVTTQVTQRVSVVGSIHWVVGRMFRLQGFRWELRRNGELKLGLWRKSWLKNKRKANPKRLLFFPGFGDTPLSWLTVFLLAWPAIKSKYDEVVLVTFPGFAGFLENEKSFHSMDLLIKATLDVCDELRPHTIMGHSMGGFLAAHYAAACGAGERGNTKKNYHGPDLVILVDSSGAAESESERENLEKVLHSIGREGFKVLRPHAFAKEPFWFRLVSRDFAKCFEFEEVSQLALSFRPDHWVQSKLHKIRSKVWVIWGEKDTLLPSNHVSVWLEALQSGENPNSSKGVLLKNLGHSPQIENPTVTAAVLSQILLGRDPHAIGKRWWKVLTA